MRVAVIGSGIVGNSVAWHLTERGADVVIHDPAGGCSKTSSQASGGFRHQFSSTVNMEFSKYSYNVLRSFDMDFDVDPDFRENGYLFLIDSRDDLRVFKDRAAVQRDHGINTRRMEPDELAEEYPELETDDLLAGFYHDKDAIFQPQDVCKGFLQQAQVQGAELVREPVTGIEHDDRGFRIDGERYDAVVNCAGPWAAGIAQLLDVRLPLSPRRREVGLVDVDALPPSYPLISDFGSDVYFRPWKGRTLIGGCRPDPDLEVDPISFPDMVRPEWSVHALERASARASVFEGAEFEEAWPGMYTVTPDRKAIIDEAGPDRFYHACGFSGHGAMHSPATGLSVAEMVMGESRTLPVEELALDRFELYEI